MILIKNTSHQFALGGLLLAVVWIRVVKSKHYLPGICVEPLHEKTLVRDTDALCETSLERVELEERICGGAQAEADQRLAFCVEGRGAYPSMLDVT